MTERAFREYPALEKLNLRDTVYHEAMRKMQAKYMAGVEEHGGNMTDANLSTLEWLIEAQKESIDQTFYLEKLIQDFKKRGDHGNNGKKET